MGKFKIGDRVIAKNRGYEDGEHEAVVISDDNGSVLVEFNDGWTGGHDAQIHDSRENRWYSSYDELELLTVAEQPAAWQPKVGDRVRLVKDGRSTTGAIGKTATITAWSDGTFINEDEYLLDIDPPIDYETLAVTKNFTRAKIDCFEPLPVVASVAAEAQPATLKIVEGRYYKTRDGRKVGPMFVDKGAGTSYPFGGEIEGEGGANWYTAEGNWWDDGTEAERDIIAEWVDEPAAKASVGAQVDTIAEEYGPVVAASNDNDPKASTAGFTIPLVDDEPANDNTLTVTLSLDADELHEELDEIIAKLKKIRKLQRQVGLAA